MSSEQLADGVNPLDAELAATWDVLKGYSGRDTDLGIARRFGGAAAAYSLRDIGAMNGRVVKARRDVGETSDPEEDFSANQVQDGTLERWVNGELETTLPADVDTAAAAYSLRKVKASYSGDAVRIRRSPDDVEVDVAFDSDNKVSASSAITNIAEQGGESGSTTATDLNGFLNETLTVGVAVEGGNGTDRPDSFTNATNSSFTATVTEVAGGYFPYTTKAGDVVTVSFDLVLSGAASPSIATSTSVNTVSPASNGAVYTSSGSYTFTATCTADGTHIRFADGDDGTFAVTNFKVTSHTHQAFVHTWYDQAGSNDAVQETAANQPKIAEGGALLADGVTFDGTNDFLQTSTQVLTGTETGANSMYAVIKQTSGDGGYICGSAGTGGSGARVGQSLYSSDTDKVILTDGQDASTGGTLDSITRIEGSNYLISVNYSNNNTDTLHSNSNANGYSNGSSAYAFSAGTKFTIGARDGSTAEAVLFDGSMKEIIAYDSDQSDNRFKIESNINNYYGLYTFQGDGFVETWYDQSGSGNDATQTTAGQQPKIVENGSIFKNAKGFPSIKFESANSTELDIGLLISNLNSVSAYVVQQKDTGDTLRLAGFTQGVSSDDSRFYLTFYSTNGTLPHFGYNDSATKISFGTSLTGTTNMYSVFAGDTNIEAFKNGTSVGTTALVDQAVTDTSSKIGQLSNSFYFDGNISEIFLTTQKLQDDAATINSDVTSYYNL